jgi:arylsulfatase A-like enzyme
VQRAVRDERWKLIRYPEANRTQLFDLQSDPNEMNDLGGDPGHAAELQRMTALLQDWQCKLDDQLPLRFDQPPLSP